MTKTQQKLVELMQAGHRLMWWGDKGPELSGYPLWPQQSTVRILLKAGVLQWGDALNKTQEDCGIYPIVLTEPGG